MAKIFLKDLSEGTVDAVIITKTSTVADVETAIAKAKEKDDYQWEDLLEALPDDCEVIDGWSADIVYY